jgi:putative hemolysin
MTAFEILVVLGLILLNGFFAMSELAMVSARKARLQGLADRGSRGARLALRMASDPGRFLSTVQIGITLIGILAGAFSGVALAARLDDVLATIPLLAPIAESAALGIVVVAITYVSLIIGELVPKHLALRHAEAIAVVVAWPMRLLSHIAAPAVLLLDGSTKAVLRLLGARAAARATVTEEEIKTLIAEATKVGIVEAAEQEMISGVMRLADRPARAIMTPRPDVRWLDVDEPPDELRSKLAEHAHSRFPVCRGVIDDVIGIVQVRDILNAVLAGAPVDLKALSSTAPIVPDRTDALAVLTQLKRPETHMVIVVDEYGSVEGVVTRADILEAIVGELMEHEEGPSLVRRDDGSWLVDGSMPVDEVFDTLHLHDLDEEHNFHTLAGFVLSVMGHIPKPGEHFDWYGHRFEVVDVDGRRIDKVAIARLSEPSDAGAYMG